MSVDSADTSGLDAAGGIDDPEAPDELVLAGEFPAAEHQRWSELVDGVLRKARRLADDSEPDAGIAKLTRRTDDGVALAPLYTREDTLDPGLPGFAPFTRGATAAGPTVGGWDVRVRHDGVDATDVREAVLADLERGAGSVWLRLGDGAIAIDDLGTVLADVDVELAAVVLDAGEHTDAAADAFLALLDERDVDRARVRGSLGADPIGLLAATGSAPDTASVAPLADRVAGSALHVVTVDALPYHQAGGSDAQQVACSLAAGVAYLRAFEDAGVDPTTAAALVEFRYAATADQFGTIALLRAARTLWSRVLQACGVDAEHRAQTQHAVTSPAMLTRRDPWVNMLRGTVAGFAAGTGGAQAVTVSPFDAAIGRSDDFARRIARNTHALLIEEAHVARVADPAGGSWYVERRTADLAAVAWSRFQEIERGGGIVAALNDGSLADSLAESATRRARDIATRRRPITGVSEFAFPAEKPVRREAAAPSRAGGLPQLRFADPFEDLRDWADEQAEDTGARPAVVLATLGAVAAHAARAGFARNLFAAGGFDAPDLGATSEPAELVAALEGTPEVACLCGTDDAYRGWGADAVAALRAAGVTTVLLAGPASLEIDGVDDYVFTGCDAVAVLGRLRR